MSTKQCRKCNEEKPTTQFSKHLGTTDKLDNRCKECVKKVKKDSNKKSVPREKDHHKTDYSLRDWQGGKYVGSVFERKFADGFKWN